MRVFHDAGLCVPRKHYMVDLTAKIDLTVEMVDRGLYFTVNRPRQYGKTTMLFSLEQKLSEEYLVLFTSFEGVDDRKFKNSGLFCAMFTERIAQCLKLAKANSETIDAWLSQVPADMDELGNRMTALCEMAEKPVVLMIDEVDNASNYKVLLSFLGKLRDKCLLRDMEKDNTFQSVILAGVHDIRNPRQKTVGENALKGNRESRHDSPWNIATDFLVDMSFSQGEIEGMLSDYEEDVHTGMDIAEIAKDLYGLTNGYPFLVSKLCKIIDERVGRDWTRSGVQTAAKLLLKADNTLFDDIYKNLEAHPRLHGLACDLIIAGKDMAFSLGKPEIAQGHTLGILAEKDGKVVVSNPIFEMLITSCLVSKAETRRLSQGHQERQENGAGCV